MDPAPPAPLLLRNGEVDGRGGVDLLIRGGRIAAIGNGLRANAVERVIDLDGGWVLPALRDHHIHLLGTASRRGAVACRGGPDGDLGWLRRGLLDSVAGLGPEEWVHGVDLDPALRARIDRGWLDAAFGARPARIDDSSGHASVLSSAALERVARLNRTSAGAQPLLRAAHRDGWLTNGHRRVRLPATRRPDLSALAAELARFGITGVSDATPRLGAESRATLATALADPGFPLRVQLMGTDEPPPGASLGPAKIVLADYDLPPYRELLATIREHHRRGRPVAVHAVTAASLYLLLRALEEAGPLPGDRVEHASVTPPPALPRIARLGLTVVTQPHFVRERGDRYLAEVDPAEQPWLYRLRTLRRRGIPLAAGSDAPVGGLDPWRAMRAATERTTEAGDELGRAERLTPGEALELYLGGLERPGIARRVRVGIAADLCLLGVPRPEVERSLDAALVRATLHRGRLVHGA